MSVAISSDCVVCINYVLKDADGVLIDSSEGSEPLKYVHGADEILPGLEKALTGKYAGDTVQVLVNPVDAYGERDPELIQVIDISTFEGIDDIKVGMTFEAETPEGETQEVLITAVDGDEITVDANHPLAGKQLAFEVSIVSVDKQP